SKALAPLVEVLGRTEGSGRGNWAERLLARNAARACREQAACTNDPARKEEYLKEAKRLAQKALALAGADPEESNTLAGVKEELAALRGDGGLFAEACADYSSVVESKTPRALRALLGRGRCRVRWTQMPEKSPASDCPEGPRPAKGPAPGVDLSPEVTKRLDDADADLREVEK